MGQIELDQMALPQPHHPHYFENFALRVEPRVADTASAKPALLVKALDRVWTSGRFAGGPPGVIGEVF